MNDLKLVLIEKEKQCYLAGDTVMAALLARVIDYIVLLEG
jgi:hypothetical protein